MIIRGSVLSAAGETETGIAQIRQGLTAWQDTGAGFLVPYFRGLMAAAHARAGDSTEALMLLADPLAHVDRTGERGLDRKRVGEGKRVSGRGDLGGRRHL